ncbi:unnamed protein product [Agarophyton chilense]
MASRSKNLHNSHHPQPSSVTGSGKYRKEEIGEYNIPDEYPKILLYAKGISNDKFFELANKFTEESQELEQIVLLFKASSRLTSTADCRTLVQIVWKEGGLSWLQTSSLDQVRQSTNLGEDDARRIQIFARNQNFTYCLQN